MPMPKADNPNVPRRAVLWFATIAATLLTAFMALFFSQSGWSASGAVLIVAVGSVSVGLALTLVNAARYWWAMRMVTFVLFATFFCNLIYVGYAHPNQAGSDNVWASPAMSALRGFLFFGLPSLLYTLWGSTWGKLGLQNPQNVTRSDVLVLRVALVGRWLFLVLCLWVVVSFFFHWATRH